MSGPVGPDGPGPGDDPRREDGGLSAAEARDAPGAPDDVGPVGPFPSWGALYATVAVWCLTMVVLLYLFTVFLNAPGGTGVAP